MKSTAYDVLNNKNFNDDEKKSILISFKVDIEDALSKIKIK